MRQQTRQLIVIDVEKVQTSCGYAVPFMDYREERPTLKIWAADKGAALTVYWAERNRQSIDGLPTGIEQNL